MYKDKDDPLWALKALGLFVGIPLYYFLLFCGLMGGVYLLVRVVKWAWAN